MTPRRFTALLLLVLALAGAAFYWYDLKPRNARAECGNQVLDNVADTITSWSAAPASYELCLHRQGLDR